MRLCCEVWPEDLPELSEAPWNLIDQLGGWSLQSVGQGYGDGYPLTVLQQWMGKLD